MIKLLFDFFLFITRVPFIESHRALLRNIERDTDEIIANNDHVSPTFPVRGRNERMFPLIDEMATVLPPIIEIYMHGFSVCPNNKMIWIVYNMFIVLSHTRNQGHVWRSKKHYHHTSIRYMIGNLNIFKDGFNLCIIASQNRNLCRFHFVQI